MASKKIKIENKGKKKIIVSIIGGTGQMGRLFKPIFEKHGCKVLIASRKTKLSIEEAAKLGDIVIVTVPIDATVNVIKKIARFVRKDAVLTDFTSLKVKPMKAMLKAKSEVVGCHPMFGPSLKSLKKQTVILVKGKGNKWFFWLKSFFEKEGARVKITTAKKHDEMMAVIQGLVHFSSISVVHALKDLGIDIHESLEFTSPVYKLRMIVLGRILNQDPRLYADIEIMNPKALKTIDAYINSSKKLREIIRKKNTNNFIKFFEEAAKELGNFKKQAEKESDYLIEKMVDKK